MILKFDIENMFIDITNNLILNKKDYSGKPQ